ncbi:MAG: hypothetical protein Q8K22_15045 [Rhodoferax sp.]|nr:hypothetical protein [Rhodoferax sp.]
MYQSLFCGVDVSVDKKSRFILSPGGDRVRPWLHCDGVGDRVLHPERSEGHQRSRVPGLVAIQLLELRLA